jgi:DNA-binding NarL/FixJ family response regulator
MSKQAAPHIEGKLRILLAEDHLMVREGLKALIDSQPDMQTVNEVGDGIAAVEQAKEMLPDLIVLDISMPRMNGLEALKKLRRECPSAKVLILTRHTDVGFLQQLLSSGAAGYVLKQSASSELIRAIRAVAGGSGFLDPAITSKVIDGYVQKHHAINIESPGRLSEREEEVLQLIAWGYSNKEIAAKLDISVKTVEAHKANSMRKLDLQRRIDIVRYALLRGWLKEG